MANNRFRNQLTMDDLIEGQKLIQVQSASFSHDRVGGTWSVTRKTKTRLVLTLLDPYGKQTAVHRRMIVRDGLVTSKEEGQGEYTNPSYFYTLDDPALEEIRELSRFESVLGQARKAADEFAMNRTPEYAKKAIQALQKYVELAETLKDKL